MGHPAAGLGRPPNGIGCPDNVRVVGPDDPISSYALLDVSDVVLTYASTIGLEAAVRGLPVAVAALTHYRECGFTIDVTSHEELERALDAPRALNDDQVELARRYAFTFFFRCMIPFPSVPTEEGFATAVPSDPRADQTRRRSVPRLRLRPDSRRRRVRAAGRARGVRVLLLADGGPEAGPRPREPGNGADRRSERTRRRGGRPRYSSRPSMFRGWKRRTSSSWTAIACSRKICRRRRSGRRIPRCGRPTRRCRARRRRHEVRARLSQARRSGTSPLTSSPMLSSSWSCRPGPRRSLGRLSRARSACPAGCDRGRRARPVRPGRPTRRGRGARRARITGGGAFLKADIAVVGAGQTMLEAAAAGTPTVSLLLVDNQRRQAEPACRARGRGARRAAITGRRSRGRFLRFRVEAPLSARAQAVDRRPGRAPSRRIGRGAGVKVAVLGLGSAGPRHAENARALGHEVFGFDPHVPDSAQSMEEAIDDIRCRGRGEPERAPRRAGARGAAAGKPTFVEKPLAVDRRRCGARRRVAREAASSRRRDEPSVPPRDPRAPRAAAGARGASVRA